MKVLACRRRGAARTAALVGVVVVMLSAAGCARLDPSAAAYVGSTKISQQQVDDAVDGVSEILEEGQSVSRAAVVNALIHGAIAEQVAAANKITITDGERDTLIKNSNLASLLNVPKAQPLAYDVADQQIVAEKIGNTAYLAAVAEQPVTLNPRFGVLDPKQKTIIADQSASLAEPAPTPTP